ncbi:glycoside hydrolase, partial [Tothia fuscella]
FQSLALAASLATLATAHGHLKEWIIDGTTYPAFDPLYDHGPTFTDIKRIEYGFPKLKNDLGPGVNPVADVNKDSITCRWKPLEDPKIMAEARAGATMAFKWTDWFSSHKGPVLTYMGLLPPSAKVEDVDFFKIDELAYDPKTRVWGSDYMMDHTNNTHTVTIPSDLKPGVYVVRHEIIALHGAMSDNYKTKVSGAQFYPQCAQVKITGDGTATPSGGKFPGLYKWDDKGILINIFFRPNEYFSPGGPVY